ncbi:MAG: hypothetical protein ABJG55_07030 [Paracoccaceae bacterium]
MGGNQPCLYMLIKASQSILILREFAFQQELLGDCVLKKELSLLPNKSRTGKRFESHVCRLLSLTSMDNANRSELPLSAYSVEKLFAATANFLKPEHCSPLT